MQVGTLPFWGPGAGGDGLPGLAAERGRQRGSSEACCGAVGNVDRDPLPDVLLGEDRGDEKGQGEEGRAVRRASSAA